MPFWAQHGNSLTAGDAGFTDLQHPTKTVKLAIRMTFKFGSMWKKSGATARPKFVTQKIRARQGFYERERKWEDRDPWRRNKQRNTVELIDSGLV